MSAISPANRRARGLYLSVFGVLPLTVATTTAFSQDQSADNSAQKPAAVEEVVVTGSRIARQNAFDTPTPVTTLSAQDMKMSGSVDVGQALAQIPGFVAATNGGAQSNLVPGGEDYLNLRGLTQVRNLVLVNGRRFTVQGTDLTTDINTIPQALIERTEVVTGGSSAVYGSDAVAGVVNFIMKKDFQGVELDGHVDLDRVTRTPTYSTDITAGSNFDDDRGNVAVSMDYLNRGAISRQQVPYAVPALTDGCVTPGSYSNSGPGTPVAGNPSGAKCLAAGGVMGLIASGSADIPDGRFVPITSSLLPGGSNAAVNAGYAAGGLSGVGAFGWTYNDAGTTARPALDPQDRYNNSLVNYLQVPQERWMINSFAHYDIAPKVTAYAEFNFSDNTVTALLAPSNADGTFIYNVNNPYATALQPLFTALDAAETGKVCSSLNAAVCTTPNDGLVALSSGRRFVETGDRINVSDRESWRFVGGFKGDLGDVTPTLLTDISYDAYYMYTRTNETDHQTGAISKSRLQAALLSVGGAPPVCNIFGLTMSTACSSAIAITSSNLTHTVMSGGGVSLTGTIAKLWAGPVQFVLGGEHRYTFAEFDPDFFLSSGDVAGFNPQNPTHGHESVTEGYGELRVPLLANLPGVDNFSVDGAFRRSDYDLSGIGSVWTYSGGADWHVTRDAILRGQFQHSIRAPNVGELYGGNNTQNSVVADPCSSQAPAAQQTAAVRAVCVAQGVNPADVFTAGIQPNPYIPNTIGGNPNLSAEASDTVTFGTVLTPRWVPNFALSVDWYRIRVAGAIYPLSGGIGGVLSNCYITLADANSVFCKAITRDPGTGQIISVNAGNANSGLLKTEGFDIQGQYHHDIPWSFWGETSSVSVSSDWTYVTQFTLVPIKDQPNINQQCVGAYGPTCGEPDPSWKGITRLTWTNGPLDLGLRWRFIDSVTIDKYLLPIRSGGTIPPLNTLTNPVLPNANYLDLSATWNITDKLQVTGGVNNLLNWGPPIVGSSAGYGNTWPATYDPYGQTFFFNARLQL